jgi:hypothetical protein
MTKGAGGVVTQTHRERERERERGAVCPCASFFIWNPNSKLYSFRYFGRVDKKGHYNYTLDYRFELIYKLKRSFSLYMYIYLYKVATLAFGLYARIPQSIAARD